MKIMRLLLVVGLIMAISSMAEAQSVKRVASIKDANGAVEIMSGSGTWTPAKVGMVLQQGDIIRTKANSWALINVNGIAETATVELKQNAQLKMATLLKDNVAGTQDTLLDLSLGSILIKAKKLHSENSRFEVKTPTSIVGVRGTTFSVSVEVEAPE